MLSLDYGSFGMLENIMNSQSQTTPPDRSTRKSVLLPLGIFLILLGVFAPGPLSEVAQSMEPGGLRSIVFISVDALRICFFGGVACFIIGVLRNRKR